MRCWFEGPPGFPAQVWRTASVDDWVNKLESLGFFVLGVKALRMPLWGPTYREVALAARDSRSFGSIVLRRDSTPVSLYFYTLLRGGGMVFTRNLFAGREAEPVNLSVRNVVSDDFGKIFASHDERLRAAESGGRKPEVQASQAGRVAATRAFYASDYYREARKAFQTPLLLSLVGSVAVLVWAVIAPRLR